MVKNMKVTGKMIKKKVEVNIFGLMGIFMMVFGKMINGQEWDA